MPEYSFPERPRSGTKRDLLLQAVHGSPDLQERGTHMTRIIATAVAFAAGIWASSFCAATTVTMDFSGDVVITGTSGPTDYAFSGSLTWDPAEALVSTGCFDATTCYPASATFVFDSVDETANIVGADIANIAPATEFQFGFQFSPFIFLAGVPAPITEFIGTALSATPFTLPPTDLTQLLHSAASSGFSLGEGEFATFADGSLTIANPPPVPPGGGSAPEPSSLGLTALSLALIGAMGLRRRDAPSLPIGTVD
jgi:hypothetical protein